MVTTKNVQNHIVWRVRISVFFVALVTNIPLYYPVVPFFNNEKQESEAARIQSLSPDISFLAAFPLAFCFSREPLPLRGSELVLSYVSLPGPQPF